MPLHDALSGLVEGVPPVLRRDTVVRNGWASAAVEDELEGPAAERLGAACARAGYGTGWAREVPWTAGRDGIACHLALTGPAIQELARDVCLGSPFVLLEARSRFVVASDGDLYWMLGGPRAFVEAALGHTVQRQAAAFATVAAAYGRSGSLAGRRLGAVMAALVTRAA